MQGEIQQYFCSEQWYVPMAI